MATTTTTTTKTTKTTKWINFYIILGGTGEVVASVDDVVVVGVVS